MVSTDSIKPAVVDVSPIIVTEIVVDGRRLVAKQPIRYEVVFEDDAEEPLYKLEGEFDMYLFAETREILIDMLHDVLEVLWQDFAEADLAELSGRAQELGEELRRRFGGVASAP